MPPSPIHIHAKTLALTLFGKRVFADVGEDEVILDEDRP